MLCSIPHKLLIAIQWYVEIWNMDSCLLAPGLNSHFVSHYRLNFHILMLSHALVGC